MQVASATLWSCFPVSASGADVLLFSLLHTSSGCHRCHRRRRRHRPDTNPSHRDLVPLPFFSSISLTFSPFFKPSPLPACSLCFPSFSPQKPLFSSGVQAALRGRPLGREGEPDSCFSPLSLRLSLCYLSVCTLDLISLSSQSSPSTILTHPHSSSTFTCSTQIIAGVWLQFWDYPLLANPPTRARPFLTNYFRREATRLH